MRNRIGITLAMAVTAATVFARQAPAPAAQQAGTDQTPSFRSGVEVVTVDVGVVDKQGRPVPGLTAADFAVTVAGRPRRVVTSEFVERPAPPPAGAPKPEPALVSTNEGGGTGRLFAFIVDQNTLDIGSARRVAGSAAPFFSRLTFADRSALLLMPLGPNVNFTWAHDRVREGLQRVTGTGRPISGWEYGSLAEARDISNRNQYALRSLGDRECGSISAGGIGSAPGNPGGCGAAAPTNTPAPPSGGTSAGGETGGGGGGGTTAPSGTAPSGNSGGGNQRSANSLNAFGTNPCSRDMQMQAESAWRTALMNSLASLSSLRQVLDALGRVRGDKTVILISGGWPLDEREEMSILSTVAADALAARVTLFSIYIPTTPFAADRRMLTSTPLADNYLYSGPLETLAAMTGGGSFRAEVGADAAFERLGRELAGYYRIGVEKDAGDNDGKGRRMKVQVPRDGVTVRAREIFDVRTYEDRDWAARLASAIEGPVPATDVGVRVTSYLSADPDDGSRRRLLLSGELSRVARGDATLQMLVTDLQGKKVTGGELSLVNSTGDTMPFSTNIAVPPGSYIVRVGVMDGGGRVGSVDHRVDARDVTLGALAASGPVLVRVPNGGEREPSLALDGVRQDERLAVEVDLTGDASHLEGTAVEFEIAATADGPALVHAPAAISQGPRAGAVLAQGFADMRILPPGDYVMRAKVTTGSESLGEVRRAFSVIAAPRVVAGDSGGAATIVGGTMPREGGRLPVAAAPPFGLNDVLAPPVLGAFLDRIAERPDASVSGVRELVERARTAGLKGLTVSDAQAATGPSAAFLKGLTLLADHQLEPAAASFREAMRKSADFYPAMVYLGACYAAGGKDKEAAAVWRTALIREGDTPALHVMLADAQLRQGRTDLAIEDLEPAHERWPENLELKRRFAVAALLEGQQAEGLQALDELVEKHAEDEPTLALGLLILYEAFGNRQPIETVDRDRARMMRFADAYRARGGPSLALVDTWVAAATRKE